MPTSATETPAVLDYSPSIASLSLPDSITMPARLVEAHRQLSDALSKVSDPGEPRVQSFDLTPGGSLTDRDIIVGVAIGTEWTAETRSGSPGDPLLRLYSSENLPAENAAGFVASAFNIHALSEGEVNFEVVPTGPIDALAHRMRLRPAPGGISCGHFSITAGTLGCLVRGRKAPRDQKTLILSNNHVLANVNAGKPGDDILQPGRYDGGTIPVDVIAALERYVAIDFAKPNYVDCATAEVDDLMLARREQLFLQAGTPAYFSCGSAPVAASVGLTVGKSGRTTQLTSGRISGVGATIRVNMGGGRIAVFRDQIEIRGLTGNFSGPGDSGSLIWTWDEKRQPVALLFAGGGGLTFGNPIQHVLTALDIDLI